MTNQQATTCGAWSITLGEFCPHSEGKHSQPGDHGHPYCSKCADFDDESAGDAHGYSRHEFVARELVDEPA